MTARLPLLMAAIAVVALLGQVKDLTMSQQLPVGTRIEVLQGASWIRAGVSEDEGPGASKIKIRTEPNNTFMIVPRKTVRIAPRPSSLKVGDRVEWYDTGTYKYLPSTIKGIGSGSNAGSYLMSSDKYPRSETYSDPKNIWTLPDPPPTGEPDSGNPTMGKYRCLTYSTATAPPIFLGNLDLRAGGSYTGLVAKEGRYSYDAASKTITWLSGNMKDSNFGGKVESNAIIRITRNTICSHE